MTEDIWDAVILRRLEKNLEGRQIDINYTLKNGSLRHKTFNDLHKAFNFWMSKPDGMATIVTDPPSYSAYTHRDDFGLRDDEFARKIIYKHFLEGITPEE